MWRQFTAEHAEQSNNQKHQRFFSAASAISAVKVLLNAAS